MDIMQLDQSATQKECNMMEKAQRKKNNNMELVTRIKYGEKKCTKQCTRACKWINPPLTDSCTLVKKTIVN